LEPRQHRPDLFVGVVLEVLGGIRIERRVVMITEYLQWIAMEFVAA
jgi:hypothetical protein